MDIKKEALRYMGCGGNAPDEVTASLLDKAYNALCKDAAPKYCYKLTDRESAAHLLLGKDINEHIGSCEHVVIFAATLGAETDRLIRTAEISNMASVVILDAAASAFTEDFCDKTENEIKNAVPGSFTWRYSPGYGDYPISVQRELIRFLNADKLIGLTATESDILVPRKSVTAVIGVSESAEIQPGKKRGCGSCDMREKCLYRKGNTYCGKA